MRSTFKFIALAACLGSIALLPGCREDSDARATTPNVAAMLQKAHGIKFEPKAAPKGAISDSEAREFAMSEFNDMLQGDEVRVATAVGRMTDTEYYRETKAGRVYPILNRPVWIAAYRGVEIPSMSRKEVPPNRTAFVAVDALTGQVLELFSDH